MTREEFRKTFRAEYRWLMINNKKLLDKMIPRIRQEYNLSECMRISSKYSRRIDWQRGHENSYAKALKSGWLDFCCKHMQSTFIKASYSECKKNSMLYPSKSAWEVGNKRTYEASRRHGWFEELTAHMPKNNRLRKVINLTTGMIFNSVADATRYCGLKKSSNLSSILNNKTTQSTFGGYRWAYCDEFENKQQILKAAKCVFKK